MLPLVGLASVVSTAAICIRHRTNDDSLKDDLPYCVSVDDIRAAAVRIKPYVKQTPIFTCGELDKLAGPGVSLFFKCEVFQKTGSFKIRGATNACFSLTEKQAAQGLVTHSSGNHAQAVALAAMNRGIPAYIIMPNNAPIPKKNAVIHTYGGTVFECEPTNAARSALATLKQAETGAEFIHPSNDPRVIAGQGTIALEILDQLRDAGGLDAIIVPVGGGGMISGIAVAVKQSLPSNVRVYGVEPARAADAMRAKEAGQSAWKGASKHIAGSPHTCADGLKTCLLSNNWPIVRDLVDHIFEVSESAILDAMELVVSRLKLAIEPSAATGVALALSSQFRALGHKRVAIVICGGNGDYGAVINALRKKYVQD